MPDPMQPSTANVATACAIIGLVTGYLIGQAKSLGLFGGSPIAAPAARKEKALGSDESSDEDGSAPNEFPGHGKIGAQCGHATLACYKQFLRLSPNSAVLKRWERSGQMKVALQVKSEEELEVLQAQALSLGLKNRGWETKM
ncbi:uncharacterized protein N0V89_003987 [Didymosphaeria variabile]|uniref:peptidyl-tRNA hydrolase n=1 Tax=Didymosphaeria variabile TaxID=1932322 RepID=A0A9W9CD12_9PLEO|nr:uncharacterized protein N0V89_003987 [Didymosphaeria variabile]KAJ4355962.1 hypothetical protein N0V89_003987 [Didymosphaeria variabile]